MAITTLADLQKSAHTFQKDLLIMPVVSAAATLRHMAARPGTRGRRTVGELSGDIELAPYKSNRRSTGDFTITPRTLETFLGNCAQEFAPDDIWDTIYGSLIVQGEELKNVDIAKQILFYAAGLLGKKLNMAIWKAKREDAGDTTMTLFNGFDTISEEEITKGSIAKEKGNFIQIEEIDSSNAVDTFKAIFAAASDELQATPTKMYCSMAQYRAYCEDYKATTGAVPYNTEFKKTTLEGSDDLCELVPLASKKGSSFIHLSPKANMLYGYGAGLVDESIAVEKYSSWVLTLEAAMYFGTQFESISSERLMVAKIGE